jgi:hypothetical protein
VIWSSGDRRDWEKQKQKLTAERGDAEKIKKLYRGFSRINADQKKSILIAD